MNKYLNSLFALLALQLVVAGWLYFNDAQQGEFVATPILSIDLHSIAEVEIKQDDKQLILNKTEENWQLSTYPQLALNTSSVDSVLKQLSTLKAVWPVAYSKASHARFKVAEDNFAKQVTLTLRDGSKQTLLLGKSPSFKKLYVRNDEQDEVYSVEFSAYQLSIDENSWLDKSLLAVRDVNRIEHANLALEKQDGKWQLATSIIPQDSDQKIDSQKVQSVANIFSQLSFVGVSKQQMEQSEQLRVTNNDAKQYQFAFAEQSDSHFVKRDDLPYWFEVSKTTYDTLVNLRLDTLRADSKDDEEQGKTLSE
ncbi:hypothetical protein PA25_25250 [Pseudoalteromonas sp. A25]|uniref:DUF4340 domain-containing protein n=1 Tax=Pseudoalteromonas sp. A25 TaxID=116092 RepID=UPI001260B692|nr:DUF4340 domain-containing protein [Pseudoalteromonas sp. A25]BBN82540.1 hypothetical protein PA25_25250 [Pseudoalteromonas sp. A25]